MTNDNRNQKNEKLELFFYQFEEYLQTGTALKAQLERLLENDKPAVVREPVGNYHTTKQSDLTLMPDYHIDDNGKITDVEFTVVKQV